MRIINPWLVVYEPQPQASLRLFCFPFAGGSASIFRSWAKDLPSHIEVCAIQLPGREYRLSESPFECIFPLVDGLLPAVYSYLDKPFVFFGHSMGALIAYELAQRLRQCGGPRPEHLFVSAHDAPHLSVQSKPIYHLPTPEFVEELKLLNGTPDEILQNPELLDLFLPLLRADFAVAQTYSYRGYDPLDCPITALGGLKDKIVEQDKLLAWQAHTNEPFHVHMFPGDHFFLSSARQMVLYTLKQYFQAMIG